MRGNLRELVSSEESYCCEKKKQTNEVAMTLTLTKLFPSRPHFMQLLLVHQDST